MTVDIQTLEDRYIDSCRRQGVLPNSSILSSLFKAEVKKSNHELCKLEILIDDLKDVDIAPLLNLCMNFDASEIEAVDVRNESSCVLNGEYALSLMRAVNKKLRVVHLQDLSYGKDFLRGKSDDTTDFSLLDRIPFIGEPFTSTTELTDPNFNSEDPLRNFYSLDEEIINHDVQSMVEDSSDDSEVDFTSRHDRYWLSDVFPGWSSEVPLLHENEDEEDSLQGTFMEPIADVSMKYMSRHASPICYEKHYREFMIASLPNLKNLDNMPIRKIDKERATGIFSQYFEYLPYKWKHKESVVSILQKREIKSGHNKVHSSKNRTSYPSGQSQYFYTRSLSAAKLGSSTWPFLHPLSLLGCELDKGFHPRQFEYHPSDSSLMVFGTLDGEVVVINHENEHIVSYIPSLGAMNSVLGLCWLKKYPSKLIAGSDNGSLKLYDIHHIPRKVTGIHGNFGCVTFDEFDQLTSVHVNSTDELFLASGYSRNVALYDINSGKRLQVFTDMHRGHINVVKFANHSPSIFATSSFDHDVKMWDLRQKPIHPCFTVSSSRGNVMVCFSPDDQYILASAVDNEVRQYLAVDGKLHLVFDIAPTESSQNYTRSYYMNGRDYIISGSCDEHVRICCAQTGRRLRDISLEGRNLGSSVFVQSLRGDPFRDFNMSVLAAYMRPGSKSKIVKINLLASSGHANKDDSDDLRPCPFHSMGA
ncbi:hypothetical protein PHAVU_007G042500 [Phaseolus vulgaris]|uniref:protein DWD HYPERSENSITIVE TO UV-B 1 isoform X3 n=1 Tax=Phaseolus vulgaris TaxID=3885 RepID=UPI0035CBCA0B